MQAPIVIFSGRQTWGQKLIRAWWENVTDMWSKNIWLPISQYAVSINYFRLISYWQCWVQSPASSIFLQNMCFLSSIRVNTARYKNNIYYKYWPIQHSSLKEWIETTWWFQTVKPDGFQMHLLNSPPSNRKSYRGNKTMFCISTVLNEVHW